MNKRTNLIPRSTILDLGDYERNRDDIRRSAIAARAVRRIHLGPSATISFENRETVAYQIQEMLRAERIAKEPEVQHEIETYSDLLPASDELSATLMFEFPEADGRRSPRGAGRLRESSASSSMARARRRPFRSPPARRRSDQCGAVHPLPARCRATRRVAARRGRAAVSDHPSYAYPPRFRQRRAARCSRILRMMYDLRDAKFWDEADLDRELRRVFDVCHTPDVLQLLPVVPRAVRRGGSPRGKGRG
jgi:hypothetical protein